MTSLCGCALGAESQAGVTEGTDGLEIHFIDVGQGDATLIKCGDKAMLIDAGENDKGVLVQNYISKQGVKALDYFIVTGQHRPKRFPFHKLSLLPRYRSQ